MEILSLNKAAKRAGVAKATILEALNTNDVNKKMSAEKNARGHWEISVSELERVFGSDSSYQSRKPTKTPDKNHQKPLNSSALEVEVKALREQIARMDEASTREREQAGERIEDLRGQLERQSGDHRQALAALTDQRMKASEPLRKGFWSRLTGG
jgi:hypothetical protein